MPLVSIITPSWNVAPLIGETIASVQAQTFTDWELLIADDCSTDQTAAVVESHAASDPRIKLIRQPRNGGPALARQAAIEQAQGRFIAFLDSDDLWLPAKLERQIAFAQSEACGAELYGVPPHQRDGIGHRPTDRGAGLA